MGILKLNEEYDRAAYEDEYNHEGRTTDVQQIYYDENGYPTLEPYTIIIRENSGRRGFGSLDNLFINRLRKLAAMWRDDLTPAQRNVWKMNSVIFAAARPNMEEPMPNGWSFFAEVGMAFVAAGISSQALATTDNPQDPDSLTFDSAITATGVLSFSAGFSGPPYSDVNTFIFVHQVDPEHVDRRDNTRRAYQYGFHQCLHAPAPDQPFTVQASYPFAAGDLVQVLVRIHKSLNGVTNLIL